MREGPILEAMDRQDCLALLRRLRWGHVAMTLDAMPAIRSVRFVLDDGDIRFWVSKGSRLLRAVFGTVVAFHAESIDESAGEAMSVHVTGIAQPVIEARSSLFPAAGLPPWSATAGADELIRLSTEDISGQRVRWEAS